MKICAVRSCRNISNKRPDLAFFNLPKDPFLREDWLEALEVKGEDNLSGIAVCETHFKGKDFKGGKKKELKALAVPVLNLGHPDRFESDEDFLYVPENDPEILEIQSEKLSATPHSTLKQEPNEEILKQELSPEPELETGRRPSRRAALVAAKKITNTVRNFSIPDDSNDDRCPINILPSPKPVKSPHPYGRGRPRKNPLNIDLQMECCDDFLSPVQAEYLLKAQMQYNMVMKNLRELMACNVKVTQTDVNGVPIASPSVHLKSGNVTVNSKSPAIKQMNTGSAMVVPMTLIQSPIVIT